MNPIYFHNIVMNKKNHRGPSLQSFIQQWFQQKKIKCLLRFFFKSTDDGQHLIAKVRMTLLKTGDKYATVILFRLSTHTHLRSFNTHYILHINMCTGDCVMEFTPIPLFLTFCLHIYFQWNFFSFSFNYMFVFISI